MRKYVGKLYNEKLNEHRKAIIKKINFAEAEAEANRLRHSFGDPVDEWRIISIEEGS